MRPGPVGRAALPGTVGPVNRAALPGPAGQLALPAAAPVLLNRPLNVAVVAVNAEAKKAKQAWRIRSCSIESFAEKSEDF